MMKILKYAADCEVIAGACKKLLGLAHQDQDLRGDDRYNIEQILSLLHKTAETASDRINEIAAKNEDL
jgi:hypothetical protein